MNTTLKAHNLMGCRGVTRSDFKYFKGKFYLLEINTQPGMTKLSLVPEISAYIGINFINLIKLILKDASITTRFQNPAKRKFFTWAPTNPKT